jgi:hypothetical protein
VILTLAGLAAAGSLDAWTTVGDAQVLESMGDDQTAALLYRQLSRQLAGDDPARAEALYRLGRVLLRLGRVEEASLAFDDCVRIRAWRARCLDERTEVEIGRSAVRLLPTRWTFDDTAHGLIHPFSDESGSIRIAVPPGETDPALLWTDDPIRGETDSLIVGFALEGDAPETLRFEARSLGTAALIRVRAEDIDGRRFTSPDAVTLYPTARVVEVDLEALTPDDGGAPLAPSALHRVRLVDERALAGAGGAATVVIDTFEVR